MIFKRGIFYLSASYTWSIIPHVFYVWQLGALLDLFAGWRDKPEAMAIVGGRVIDLDAVEWDAFSIC